MNPSALKERYENLQNEYNQGRQQLAEIDYKIQSLKETMLRISGAIQVLEEVLGASGGE